MEQQGPTGSSRGVFHCAGGALTAARGRRRGGAIAGGAMILAGSVFERWAIFKAGVQSATDPKYTVGPQRKRIEADGGT